MKQTEPVELAIVKAMELTTQPDTARLEQLYVGLAHAAAANARSVRRPLWPWLLLGATMAAAAAGHWYYKFTHDRATLAPVTNTERTPAIKGSAQPSAHTGTPSGDGKAVNAGPRPEDDKHRGADVIYRQ